MSDYRESNLDYFGRYDEIDPYLYQDEVEPQRERFYDEYEGYVRIKGKWYPKDEVER